MVNSQLYKLHPDDLPSKPIAWGTMISMQTSRELKEHDALDTLSMAHAALPQRGAPPNLRWLMVTFHESWPFVGAARFESIGDKPFNCGRYLRIKLVKIRWVMRSHWIASNMVSFHSNDSSARSVHSFWTYLSFRVPWRQMPVGRRWLKRCPVGNSMWLVFKGLGDVKSLVLAYVFTT